MARLMGVKLILVLVSFALAGWDYFLRDSMSLPVLSGLSSTVVYIIAGIILAICIIINWTAKDQIPPQLQKS